MHKQPPSLLKHHSALALFAALGGSLVLVILLFSLLGANPARAQATVIYVKDDSICVSACGGSWDTAYPNLQDALTAATPGTEIWVAAGFYYPDEGAEQIDDDRDSTFQLQNGVAIYGGFAGGETKRSDRKWDTNVTVLSGDIDHNDSTGPDGLLEDPSGIVGSNAYHVVTSDGVDNSAILDGFTITGGNARSEVPHRAVGGGMYDDGGSATLANLVFRANWAVLGGGLYTCLGSPHLTNVLFEHNEALSEGGGLQNDSSSTTLEYVSFLHNEATYGGGMGIYGAECITSDSSQSLSESHENQWRRPVSAEQSSNAESSTTMTAPQLTAVAFISNTAMELGGGMYSVQSTPVVSNVTFLYNSATDSGGGVFMEHVTLSSSEFSPKEAQSALHAPSLTNATFYSNTAGIGGGMFTVNISPTLTGVSFLQNLGLLGGGLATVGGNPALDDVTFATNFALIMGGGLLTFPEELADEWEGFDEFGDDQPLSSPIESLDALENSDLSLEFLQNLALEATSSSSMRINRATFTQNFALLGGAFTNIAAGPQITNSHFENNFALMGGAMFDIHADIPVMENESNDSSVTEANGNSVTSLTNVTFVNNTTNLPFDDGELDDLGIEDLGGGALLHVSSRGIELSEESTFNGDTTLDLLNVSFTGNSGPVGGAAIFANATPALANVSFSGNHAQVGGALAITDSTSILTNVTFSGNFASDRGAAMATANSFSLIQNSILWANDVANGPLITNVGGTFHFSHSLVQGSGGSGAGWDSSLGEDGGGNIDADPLFIRSPDPGDGDWTTPDDNDYGDLRLQEGSPAVNAGDNNADLDGPGSGAMTIADIPEDLAGNPRIIFDAVDMGVFELQSAELGLNKSVSTATALPGETITYTLTFSNSGLALAHGVVISDPVPVELSDVSIQSTLPIVPITGIDYAWQLPDLAPGEGGEILISAVVSTELSADTVFTNTATISSAAGEQDFKDNVSAAPVSVVLPRVSFGNSNYTVLEAEGTITIDVILDKPNPYLPVQVAYSTAPGTATPGDDYTPVDGVLTIPAGSVSTSFDIPILADDQVEPAETVQLTLSNPAAAVLGDPSQATLTILDSSNWLYLPFIAHNESEPVSLPDLIVTDTSVNAEGLLQVVIQNVGQGPVTSAFWVDAYINPTRPPVGVNDVWWKVGDQGLVWGVTESALPLAAGESLTLTYGDAYYMAAESNFTDTIAGAQLYAQVDSANSGNPFGGVVETHEVSGGAYNNIFGPVTATTTLQAPALERNNLLPDNLPLR